MAKSSSMPLLSLSLLLLLFSAKCKNLLAPAFYVFGDSLIDSGNNNFLKTPVQANYNPYGVDFSGGATGRFTNGKTVVDFLGEYLGLPLIPPYLGLSEDERTNIVTGMNYASGSGGILAETGPSSVLSMEEQVKMFEETVKTYLPRNFKSPDELSVYLSKSIFYAAFASDYIANYLQPEYFNSSQIYSPEQFAAYLLDELKPQLMKLYNLGARKFLVSGIGSIGCSPAIVSKYKPTTACAEDVNKMLFPYNNGLSNLLQQLTSSLQGSTFVFAEIYGPTYELYQNPSKYGFIERNTSCCIVGNEGTSLCLKDQEPCEDRNTHLYWDQIHPTQQVHQFAANGCFYGSSLCLPINIQQLAQK